MHLDNIQYSQLMGINNDLLEKMAITNNNIYKTVPYGNLNESLPYLVRRINEDKSLIY